MELQWTFGDVHKINTLDWFMGNFTGNPIFNGNKAWFPVVFPLNQSNEKHMETNNWRGPFWNDVHYVHHVFTWYQYMFTIYGALFEISFTSISPFEHALLRVSKGHGSPKMVIILYVITMRHWEFASSHDKPDFWMSRCIYGIIAYVVHVVPCCSMLHIPDMNGLCITRDSPLLEWSSFMETDNENGLM